jgi:hypothetical protein
MVVAAVQVDKVPMMKFLRMSEPMIKVQTKLIGEVTYWGRSYLVKVS